MGKTKIEWCERTWNPLVVDGGRWGCTKVSPGCLNCYASRMNKRFGGREYDYSFRNWKFALNEKILEEPVRRKRGTVYFVCSTCDLFHEGVSRDLLDAVFQRMATSPQHLFLVLTKRPARMREYLGSFSAPLENVWVGVSVENQEMADERIPILLETPAVKRFLSCEPLLGAVDLRKFVSPHEEHLPLPHYALGHSLHWVIVGGESGPGARPMHPGWVKSIKKRCEMASVPFFFKQWGNWAPTWTDNLVYDEDLGKLVRCTISASTDRSRIGKAVYHAYPSQRIPNTTGDARFSRFEIMEYVGKKAAGRLLDGREYNERPEWGKV